MELAEAIKELTAAVVSGRVKFDDVESFVNGRWPQEGYPNDRSPAPEVEDAINKLDVAISRHQPAAKVTDRVQLTGNTLGRRRGIRNKMLALCAHNRLTPHHIDTFLSR